MRTRESLRRWAVAFAVMAAFSAIIGVVLLRDASRAATATEGATLFVVSLIMLAQGLTNGLTARDQWRGIS